MYTVEEDQDVQLSIPKLLANILKSGLPSIIDNDQSRKPKYQITR